ncbi:MULTISPECIES: PAS domain-containing methyl-accepting chemotaxis protein [Chromobacterium]|uniref:methyl-accepting chemotaxis protein n=1 Tax=Chromobacterium TaxID=535 RepID=UPI001304DEDE|nr:MULTISPECIES: PAS domain-containing methyl-accepting chemotaxis protein [Chromobacterium]UJB30190.1 methyl-accepting chemotaxis protein [Chromobacterium sp. Beijing]
MRSNLPVDGTEVFLLPHRPIVTKTNLKGQITYANRAFIDISGFSEEELIGQPHNIVRHPDMPQAAFDDLWSTIKTGRPWKGLVKNRTKQGHFYWVEAYVTPICEGGQPVGYMSVRSAPSKQQTADAEQLYARVRERSQAFPETRHAAPPTTASLLLCAQLPAAALILAGAAADGALRLTLLTLAAVWALAASYLAGRWLARPIDAARRALMRLAEGDFSAQIPPSGPREPRAVLEEMETLRIHLRAILADVVAGAEDVSEAATATHAEAESLNARGESTLEGITRVAAALQQLSVSVNEISQSTRTGAEFADQATELASQGEAQMSDTRQAAQAVVSEVSCTRDIIIKLEQSVESINTVTGVIKDIANQTNLLALNAAIEAARAGEQGRGFAVVADEVRKLAERTAGNTLEIEQSVSFLRERSQEALEEVKAAVNKVHTAEETIQAAAEGLEAIRNANEKVAESSSSVANMLQQQSSASTEVAQSMETMSTLTEQNSHSIAATLQVAQKLHTTASDLRRLVSQFEKHM